MLFVLRMYFSLLDTNSHTDRFSVFWECNLNKSNLQHGNKHIQKLFSILGRRRLTSNDVRFLHQSKTMANLKANLIKFRHCRRDIPLHVLFYTTEPWTRLGRRISVYLAMVYNIKWRRSFRTFYWKPADHIQSIFDYMPAQQIRFGKSSRRFDFNFWRTAAIFTVTRIGVIHPPKCSRHCVQVVTVSYLSGTFASPSS